VSQPRKCIFVQDATLNVKMGKRQSAAAYVMYGGTVLVLVCQMKVHGNMSRLKTGFAKLVAVRSMEYLEE
jgi:fructose-1,6-bisphosphatase